MIVEAEEIQQDFRQLVAAHFSTATRLEALLPDELAAANQIIGGDINAFEGKLAEAYIELPDGRKISVLERESLQKLADENGLEFDFLLLRTTLSDYGHVIRATYSSLDLINIEALRGFTSLTKLDLGLNKIKDVAALKDLTSLTELWVFGNDVKDISALKNLTSLTVLGLHSNQIKDLSPLKNMTALTRLELAWNQIEDLKPLEALSSLALLGLYGNKIQDLSAVQNLPALTGLQIGHNRLNRASKELIEKLRGRGITIDV